MTLDEAIEHARWCANNSIGECSDEHRQLTEWLTELQKLRATRTRLLAEIHGLKSQNDKLQDICSDMLRCIDARKDRRSICWGCSHHRPVDELRNMCFLKLDARELGIEVE